MLFVGQKISEHSQFTISVSDSLRRLQGRRFSLPWSGRRSIARQKQYGEIHVESPGFRSSAIHSARCAM